MAAPRDALTDDEIVAYLRTRAPGLPTVPVDPHAITARARRALDRRRRRQVRGSVAATAGATAVYLVLALVGPVPVPGVGSVSVPGGNGVRALVAKVVPGFLPSPDQWPGEVDRLEKSVLPVVQRLEVSYYLLEEGPPCHILEYPRGNYRDGAPECHDLVPFDAQARADFDEITAAVRRSRVPVERIRGSGGGFYIRLNDNSWQYNYEYVYLPGAAAPPPTTWPVERWTHIRGNWWFFRSHDD